MPLALAENRIESLHEEASAVTRQVACRPQGLRQWGQDNNEHPIKTRQ
jgi:hypothetical protein